MSLSLSSFKHSVTVRAEDLAVLSCLRGLANHSQKRAPPGLSWGGTGREQWERNSKQVTFRFSDPDFRANFIQEAERLLSPSLWSMVVQTDDEAVIVLEPAPSAAGTFL